MVVRICLHSNLTGQPLARPAPARVFLLLRGLGHRIYPRAVAQAAGTQEERTWPD